LADNSVPPIADFFRLKGRRNLLLEAGAEEEGGGRPGEGYTLLLGLSREGLRWKLLLPFGLEGDDLSAMTYDVVGEDTLEAKSSAVLLPVVATD
jgi:hypothetical protein